MLEGPVTHDCERTILDSLGDVGSIVSALKMFDGPGRVGAFSFDELVECSSDGVRMDGCGAYTSNLYTCWKFVYGDRN